MSLTFEFPQWQLQVTNKRAQDQPTDDNPGNVAKNIDQKNWAEDLAELDGNDEIMSADDGQEPGSSVDQRVSDFPPHFVSGAAAATQGHAAAASRGFITTSELGSSVGAQLANPDFCGNHNLEVGSGNDYSEPQYRHRFDSSHNPRDAADANLESTAALRTVTAVISGDSIPAEVLLLVLSSLRDVGDCLRAALVCKHWLSVVALSNELWYELDSIHLTGGIWQRPPHAGRPVLQPPPGCDHPRSKMLSYKTTCALTQAAVRFMALRKGFEYVVEAASSLWLAACRAAAEAEELPKQFFQRSSQHLPPHLKAAAGQQQQLQSYQAVVLMDVFPGTGSVTAAASSSAIASGGFSGTPVGGIDLPVKTVDGGPPAERTATSVPPAGGCAVTVSACAIATDGAASATAVTSAIAAEDVAGGLQRNHHGGSDVQETCNTTLGATPGSGRTAGGPPVTPGPSDGYPGSTRRLVGDSPRGCSSGSSGGGRSRGRITHVDQLWESCGRSRAALQVDERFNAVRVQQMVGKLCSCGSAQWLPLYEGVAAVMASRCDQIRSELEAEAAAAARGAAAAEAAGLSLPAATGPKRRRGTVGCSDSNGDRNSGIASSQGRHRSGQSIIFRGEVVYSGNTYADQFAELLRRGDTHGALALGLVHRRGAVTRGGSDGGLGVGDALAGARGAHRELDEPEMREVILVDDQDYLDISTSGADDSELLPGLPAMVLEGFLLWRRLLSCWAIYRRWLEVWVVWCGPLGARVEAERQLAGAAAAHGEAPLAPPHLTNKGLLLFRSQVLLAYPLRRPLQAAALWLSARAADGEDATGSSRSFSCSLSGRSGCPGPGLSDEHGQMLTGIRKLLTELAVPDDATQPPHLHTRQKLLRCFGLLMMRRPAPGNGRMLQMAQRLQGLRAAAAAGGSGDC